MSYDYDNILDNVNFLDQVIKCIEGQANKTTKLLTIATIKKHQEKYKTKIKIKSGRKGVSPSLMNKYENNILATENEFHRANLK